MSAGHTPGPWVHHPDYNIISTRDGRMLFEWQARCQFVGIGERDANARLIAAAPELLTLLYELIDIEGPQPGTSAWANKARAIIAKAIGETPC